MQNALHAVELLVQIQTPLPGVGVQTGMQVTAPVIHDEHSAVWQEALPTHSVQ
jgi:hypothetical protein